MDEIRTAPLHKKVPKPQSLKSHQIKQIVHNQINLFTPSGEKPVRGKEELTSILKRLRFQKKTPLNKIISLNDALKEAIPESIPRGTPPTPEPGSAEIKAKKKVVNQLNKLGELRYDPDAKEQTGLPFAGMDYAESKGHFESMRKLQQSSKNIKVGGRRTRKNR